MEVIEFIDEAGFAAKSSVVDDIDANVGNVASAGDFDDDTLALGRVAELALTIFDAVAFAIGFERVEAELDFVVIIKAIVVGVDFERVSLVFLDFDAILEAVAIGIGDF